MVEIQALQTRQKDEIEALFTRMGKQPPPTVFSPAVAMAGGRRRLKSKSHKSSHSSVQHSPVHSGEGREPPGRLLSGQRGGLGLVDELTSSVCARRMFILAPEAELTGGSRELPGRRTLGATAAPVVPVDARSQQLLRGYVQRGS